MAKNKTVTVQIKVKGVGKTIKHTVAADGSLSNIDNAVRLQSGVTRALDDVTTEVRRRVGI